MRGESGCDWCLVAILTVLILTLKVVFGKEMKVTVKTILAFGLGCVVSLLFVVGVACKDRRRLALSRSKTL